MTENKQMPQLPFWKTTNIEEMTEKQWESLCDGCGKCCVYQLEDDENLGAYYPTNVVCQYLDRDLCQCTSYANRQKLVPDCMKITPENIATIDWLPETCGYRLVFLGKELPQWHPLVSDDPQSVHKAGASVSGRCISEKDSGELEDHIVEWKDF